MIRTEPILAVEDVTLSSTWYQKLLNCKGAHGGNSFEILTDNDGNQILSLHKWDDHGHPTLINPKIKSGHGFIIYFVVDDLDRIWKNATALNAVIEQKPHLNNNSGRTEFSLRDLDNYYISICSG